MQEPTEHAPLVVEGDLYVSPTDPLLLSDIRVAGRSLDYRIREWKEPTTPPAVGIGIRRVRLTIEILEE